MACTTMTRLVILATMMTALIAHATGDEYEYDDSLSYSYYHESCPEMEKIVNDKVKQWLSNDTTLAPSIIRLHFHDCVVRGCDASVLLNYEGSERRAKASSTLRGFELINEIKAEVEKKCPKAVSCSDILTAAARDATVEAGGPYWMVPYGRKDGRVSKAEEADSMVPVGRERITDLIELFQSKGLSVLDMVVLSGAHTIGRCNCGSVQKDRLFNQEGSVVGGSMDPKYVSYLRRKCRWDSDYADLDAVTPEKFDGQYYKNLQKKMGLLYTDQMMYEDSRTSPLVKAFAAAESSVVFSHQFAASMIKLGNVQDYSADGGEIRLVCDRVNA